MILVQEVDVKFGIAEPFFSAKRSKNELEFGVRDLSPGTSAKISPHKPIAGQDSGYFP